VEEVPASISLEDVQHMANTLAIQSSNLNESDDDSSASYADDEANDPTYQLPNSSNISLDADGATEKRIIVQNVSFTDEYSHRVTVSTENSIIDTEATIDIEHKTLTSVDNTTITTSDIDNVATTANDIDNVATIANDIDNVATTANDIDNVATTTRGIYRITSIRGVESARDDNAENN
jgi:hypothetical protein